MFRIIYNNIALGLYFAVGLVLGYILYQDKPISNKIVTVDIIKDNNDILVYEHYSGRMIFECNADAEADTKAYEEFNALWKKVKHFGGERDI